MITAQDIREKTFEKSKFGGYDMAEVDEFLEAIADDIANTQKETAVLRSKMKVLVDKIEEYRNSEGTLNQAILSAQNFASQLETEAKEKAEKMLSDAEAEVNETLGDIPSKLAYEKARLAEAKEATSKFFEGIRAMCNAQLKNIDNISNRIMEVGEAPVTKKVVQSAPSTEQAPKLEKTPVAEKVFEDTETVPTKKDAVPPQEIQDVLNRINANVNIAPEKKTAIDDSIESTDSDNPFSF